MLSDDFDDDELAALDAALELAEAKLAEAGNSVPEKDTRDCSGDQHNKRPHGESFIRDRKNIRTEDYDLSLTLNKYFGFDSFREGQLEVTGVETCR
jgi:hypothetical protein